MAESPMHRIALGLAAGTPSAAKVTAMGRWLVAVIATVVACGAAPPEVHYARDLAAATPATADLFVATAQRDLDSAAAQALADVAHSQLVDGHLDETGREAVLEIERLRCPAAASALSPMITMQFDPPNTWGMTGAPFFVRYPLAAAVTAGGWPGLPSIDRQAASNDTLINSTLCMVAYRWILGRTGVDAARTRLSRLVAAGGLVDERERYRVLLRGIGPGVARPVTVRWTAASDDLYAHTPLARYQRTERWRYGETDALLTALPAWLDDPAQHFRAVAALRILATLRSPEPGPLLCQRLTWVDDTTQPDAPAEQRYPAVAGLIAIGHLMYDPLVKKLGETDDPLERQLGALILERVLDGREEARAFLLDESTEAKRYDRWWEKNPTGKPWPNDRLKALAESEWLKGDDPPLVVKP